MCAESRARFVFTCEQSAGKLRIHDVKEMFEAMKDHVG
jgi:hypothetical protein